MKIFKKFTKHRSWIAEVSLGEAGARPTKIRHNHNILYGTFSPTKDTRLLGEYAVQDDFQVKLLHGEEMDDLLEEEGSH